MAHGRTPDRAGLLANPLPRLDDILRLYGISVPGDDIDEYADRICQYRFDGVLARSYRGRGEDDG